MLALRRETFEEYLYMSVCIWGPGEEGGGGRTGKK